MRSGDETKVIPVGECIQNVSWRLMLECLSLCKQQTSKEPGERGVCACSSLHTYMVLFLRMKAISFHALWRVLTVSLVLVTAQSLVLLYLCVAADQLSLQSKPCPHTFSAVTSYCIAENFRERKLSWIGGRYDFRGENFRRCSLVPSTDTTHTPKFCRENFCK